MKVERIRPAVLRVTLHPRELATLVAAPRWAPAGGESDLPPEAAEQIEQVLAGYDAQVARIDGGHEVSVPGRAGSEDAITAPRVASYAMERRPRREGETMAFTQTMTVQSESAQSLADLLEGWHREQAGVAPGYRAARVLADKDNPGRFVVEVDFSSEEEARQNNDRPETRQWAEKLQAAAQGEPEYSNYEVAYTTG